MLRKLLNASPLLIALAIIFSGCRSGTDEPISTESISSLQRAGNIHLTLGNPSDANTSDPNNYLIEKPEFALSYNCSTGTANWVSWQLNNSWLGNTERQEDFRPEPALPSGCYQVRPTDYRGSGFDRGHMTPSGDRTKSEPVNSATFVMSNMVPQTPANNRDYALHNIYSSC